MDSTAHEPQPLLPASTSRHDGWTPERMAVFLEMLADTGLVTEACRAAGMSREAAYNLRNRDPVFAAAWTAALSRARPVVADGMLERSITGTVEHYFRDGELVGTRRHYESWLGLAVLKRLDKQALDDRAGQTLAARIAGDWQGAIGALRAGGTAVVRAVVDRLVHEVDEVDIPPPPGFSPLADSCWVGESGQWLTAFPPPPGFEGHESGAWDGVSSYERDCTAEEAALLDAHFGDSGERARAEAERDAFFGLLRNSQPLQLPV